MYETYFGFREKPFNLTPDPKFLFLSRRHAEAFAHLDFGRRERGGFAVITGEVGTGKTTLARYFLNGLGATTATAVVLFPALSAVELMRAILDDLHVSSSGRSLKDLVDALHRFLLEARAQGREVVLLIDEAQDLSPAVLEQIRLISNLETDTEKLIQIVLIGQSELNELLSRRELRQLAQRVGARYHLGPLDRDETAEYVRHRIKVAEGEGKCEFGSAALAMVHRLTLGVPRLINLVCDRALLAGYVRGSRMVETADVRRAATELNLASGPIRIGKPVAAAAFAAAIAIALPAAWRWWSVWVPPSPSAAVTDAASSAPHVPIASTRDLAPLLRSLPGEASLDVATASVRSLWGTSPLERTTLRTHLDQLRRIDLPVVLEMFHPARHDTCYLALIQLANDRAVVSSGAAPVVVSVAELDRFWTRQAIVLWRDFDAVSGSDKQRVQAWARERLAEIGGGGPGEDLPSAVARFQADAQLAADGVIGSRTLMMLYTRGSYPRPHLSGGAS